MPMTLLDHVDEETSLGMKLMVRPYHSHNWDKVDSIKGNNQEEMNRLEKKYKKAFGKGWVFKWIENHIE